MRNDIKHKRNEFEKKKCFSVPSEDKSGKYLKERSEDSIREIQTSFVGLLNEFD